MDDNFDLIALSNGLANAVDKAAASTVLVNARPRLPASGVAISADLILTANHAVEREEDIPVVLANGTEVAARLAGRDAGSDLALLRLASPVALPAVPVGSEPRVGQIVLALGRPSLEGIQASQGIISAIGGPVRTGRAGHLESYIRTDAIPYPGFSGGPLINLTGEVVGINTSGFLSGASLTIPIKLALITAEALRSQGRVRRGYLGVRTQVVDLPASPRVKINRAQERGLMLVSIESNSPADVAGLIVGDILIGAEGKPVNDHETLVNLLASGTLGKTLTFEILRGGEMRSLPVQIGEQ